VGVFGCLENMGNEGKIVVVFKIDFWGGDLCAIVALLDDLYLMAPWSWNLARERGYHKKKKKKKPLLYRILAVQNCPSRLARQIGSLYIRSLVCHKIIQNHYFSISLLGRNFL
jgi:hypothetical protein